MLSVSSFSSQLVDNWLSQFTENSQIIFRANAGTALNNFSKFKDAYEQQIKAYFDEKFPVSDQTTKAEKIRRETQITEQINLALDVYWEPLARVAEQLKADPYKDFFSNASDLNVYLGQFNTNARGLLGIPNSEYSLVDSILIYFNKVAKINRYPYTDVALIGIPYRVFTQASNDRKTWMPIAHELSHHIYWNMATYDGLIEQIKKFEDGILEKLKTNDQPPSDDIINLIKPWIGEIFADAVGLQISGKNNSERRAFLDTCKELILRKTDSNRTNLSLDDGDHVPDGLRLLVPLASLGVDNPVDTWKTFLASEVGKKADDIEINLRDKDGHMLSDNKINATEVADHVCNTVKIILDEIAIFKAPKEGEASLFTIPSPSKKLVNPAPEQIANQIVIELFAAAKKLAQDNPVSTLSLALNPQALEDEQSGPSHSHTWTTTSSHAHSRTSSNHNF